MHTPHSAPPPPPFIRECSKTNQSIQRWHVCPIVNVVWNWYLPASFVSSDGNMSLCCSIVPIYFRWLSVSFILQLLDARNSIISLHSFCLFIIFCSFALLPSRRLLFEGKNLEYGLKQEGLLSFVRELNGNEEEPYDNYLRDASMYARGKMENLFKMWLPTVMLVCRLCVWTLIEICSGHIIGARSFGAKIYAGRTYTWHDQRRLDVPRCGNISGEWDERYKETWIGKKQKKTN